MQITVSKVNSSSKIARKVTPHLNQFSAPVNAYNRKTDKSELQHCTLTQITSEITHLYIKITINNNEYKHFLLASCGMT